jgi:hypothetical protein
VVSTLVALAIGGYLAGHRAAAKSRANASAEATAIASGAGFLLEHPADWHATSTAPEIPGLPFAAALILAPGGNGARAGLLAGQIPTGAASPLPAVFLAQMHSAPETEVVSLLTTQAYRYSKLRLPGYEHTLELYVIPSRSSSQTALACYTSSGLSTYMRQCQQIVDRLTLYDQLPFNLNPVAAYAQRLDTLIRALDRRRLALRRQMSARLIPTALSARAGALAGGFATTVASLALLEAPSSALAAQAALTSSLLRAHDAYASLATAARTRAHTTYAAAQREVDAAETGVDTALQSFALLGYGQA